MEDDNEIVRYLSSHISEALIQADIQNMSLEEVRDFIYKTIVLFYKELERHN